MIDHIFLQGQVLNAEVVQIKHNSMEKDGKKGCKREKVFDIYVNNH